MNLPLSQNNNGTVTPYLKIMSNFYRVSSSICFFHIEDCARRSFLCVLWAGKIPLRVFRECVEKPIDGVFCASGLFANECISNYTYSSGC